MKKKSAKKYYRKITEGLPKTPPKDVISNLSKASKISILGHEITIYFMLVLGSCAIFLLAVVCFLLFSYHQERGEWISSRDNFLYWQEVAKVQGNSPDAYYQAGIYAVKLGKNKEGYMYLRKAVDLDPEFDKAKELLQRLGR